LRRENEQLRREIWTLRDECDRLNKRFKAKLNEHEFGGCRGSGGSGGTCHAYRCSGGGGGRGSGGCDVNSDVSGLAISEEKTRGIISISLFSKCVYN